MFLYLKRFLKREWKHSFPLALKLIAHISDRKSKDRMSVCLLALSRHKHKIRTEENSKELWWNELFIAIDSQAACCILQEFKCRVKAEFWGGVPFYTSISFVHRIDGQL